MKPPWEEFPAYKPSSDLWKTGEGKEFMLRWNDFFKELDDEGRVAYRKENKPPFYWFFFYWHRTLSESWTFPFIFLLIITWPFRALHHLIIKK